MQVIGDYMDFSAWEHEPDAKQKVRPASDYMDEVIKRFMVPIVARGIYLPWPKTADKFRLRRNELTLWPGINGHGKSNCLNQVMLSAMAQGDKALIASMEMKPAANLERMAKMACRTGDPCISDVRLFGHWTDAKLWMYDHVGTVDWRKLLGVMRYCAAELGITQFVVDSLMRCGIGEQDYDGQKAFLDALCTFRMDYPVHVHLVMHSRTKEDERQAPGKFDAKGTGTMTDLADNVVTVWRNKAKEAALQAGKADKEIVEAPDCLLIVDKQRNYEWEGKIALWYLYGSMQYVENGMSGTMELMEHRP